MKAGFRWLIPGLLGSLLLGCGPVPVEPAPNEIIRENQSTSPAPQWVQFGVVQWISPATLPSGDGGTEQAMELSILLDSGEVLTVTQAVSQAGRFNVGDRVRLLHIGDFARVTFWPYENRSPQVESPLLLPGGGAPGYAE